MLFCRIVALAAALAPLGAHAQWAPQFEAGILHDDNLSRAQRSADRVSDSAWTARAALARGFALGEASDVTLAGEAGLTRYMRWHGASFATLGLNAGYRRKLGLGLTAPWIAADAAGAIEDAREEVRDGHRTAFSLSAGKRFTPQFEASATLAHDRREQRVDKPTVRGFDGKPFSVQGRSVTLRASYALGERLALLGSAALRHGDVESSTRRNPDIFPASNAIAPDPTFGPDFVAYRLSGASTASLMAGLSQELSRRLALEATLTNHDTRVGGGLNYRAVVFALSMVYRQ